MLSKDIYESLGDKAYSDLKKKDFKQKMKTLWLNKWPLRGSYTDSQLEAFGFKKFDGGWKVPQSKFDELIKSGSLQEMTLRPLPTGKAKIPNVGRKKVHENVWAFDAEKALELLKEPLLRGGGDDDPDLGCDMCGGTGCGAGYDIKDDLARYEEMLDPNADTKPEHLANDYIQKKIERLKAIVQKYPNGIPDNIDCSGGMSKKKHREWQRNKGHDAADMLYDIIGDDSFHDMLYNLAPEDDVRPLIMNWLNPSWRAEQRKGLPEYPAVEDVDFAELYKRARKIYNPLRVVKEANYGDNEDPDTTNPDDIYKRSKKVDDAPEEYTDSDFVEKLVAKAMHKDEIKKMLSDLTDVEKIVIIARFGLDNGKDYDLMQVGNMIGKSRERVRQIEAKALRKIRTFVNRNPWPEHIEEGKKFPRTSEFLFVRELEDIKRLAGVYEPYVEEGDGSMGSNISKTANKISNIMKEKNIQPGTPEWFQLWFSKPYLTGEKPYGE